MIPCMTTHSAASFDHGNGPRPLNLTQQHGPFLKWTGDIRLSDMRQWTEIDRDMRHCHFLDLTCDMGINKQQRHATLPFLKIDRRHGDPHVKGPMVPYMTTTSFRGLSQTGSILIHTILLINWNAIINANRK